MSEEIGWLVAAALILAAVGLAGLPLLAGYRARRRFETHLDDCHARLRAAETNLAAVEARALGLAPGLPAPLAAGRDDLEAALGQARAAAAALQARRRALLHQAGQPLAGDTQPGSLAITRWLDEPRRWRHLDAEAAGVDSALAGLEWAVDQAAGALAHLEKVPRRIAAACAELAERAGQAVDLADALARRGARGARLDAASAQARDLAARLEAVGCATPHETAAAADLLERLSVPVVEAHALLETWAAEVRRLDQGLEDAQRAIDDATTRIACLPSPVDRNELVDQLARLKERGQAIGREAAQPDVQALAGLVTRAADLINAAGLLADDADGAAQQHIEFAAHYQRARATLNRATVEMQAASGETIYPLDWREWAGRCAAAQRALALLGDPTASRTANDLKRDTALAARVAGQAERLMRAVEQARLQREALRRLLVEPALAPDRPWEARAAALHDAANAYAAGNWPAGQRVPQLRADAADLAAEHARWVPREPWLPLAVDTLHRRLEAVQRLAAGLQAFEPALARLEQDLAALRAAEAEAREGLVGCRRDLGTLIERVRSAQPAYDRPVTHALGSLRQFAQHAEALEAALARHDKGTVAGKAQRVQRWARTLGGHLKSLCRALDAAAGEARAALNTDLQEATQAFRLDDEPAVAAAAAHLRVPAPKRPRARGDPLARAAVQVAHALALVADRQAVSQARRDLAAATRDLPQPLKVWRETRDQARDAWNRLEATRRALAAGWPPLDPDSGRPGRLFNTACHAHDEARRQEERHLAGARHVPDAASRLQALGEAYRRATAAATEAEVAARQAHAQVQTAAEALEAALARGANAEVEREVDHLRRQWLRRPPDQQEAQRELERLRQQLERPG